MLELTVAGAEKQAPMPEPGWSLVARIQAGEREAFGELVRLYQKRVFIFAYGFFPNREDALEIVQETFMRIFEKIAGFRQDISLTGWIYRLTHNLCIDYYRKYSRKRALESNFGDVPDAQLAATDSPHAVLEARQLDAAVAEAMESLPLRQRQVVMLKYRQGLKLPQVAEAMAVSLGTVKAMHHRALKRIRRDVAPRNGGDHGSMS